MDGIVKQFPTKFKGIEDGFMAVRKIGLVQELAYHPMKGREIDVAGMS